MPQNITRGIKALIDEANAEIETVPFCLSLLEEKSTMAEIGRLNGPGVPGPIASG